VLLWDPAGGTAYLSQPCVKRIYCEYTGCAVLCQPAGGTAYLSLEQPDEPYTGGIKYTAMPPTKRFRDMEQLSGGHASTAFST
jgi:structural maintenance of chromosome 1